MRTTPSFRPHGFCDQPDGERSEGVYNLIARQYLMQFCPGCGVPQSVLSNWILPKSKFVAKARFLLEAGWRTLLSSKEHPKKTTARRCLWWRKAMNWYCEKRRSGRAANPAATPFYRCNTAFGDDRIARFVQDKDLKDPSIATDGLGQKQPVPGLLNCCSSVVSDEKRALYPLHRRRKSAIPFAARNGDATGHDRALGIGADANQRKAVRYQDFNAAAGGDIVPAD